jgi:hypothetical protein
MTYAFARTMDTSWDDYERIAEAIGDEKPEGMVIHLAAPRDGGVTMLDVWESREAYERFRESRLMPAVASVVGEQRMAAGPPAAQTIELEAQHVMGG